MLDFLGGIFSGAMDLFGQSQNISAQQQMASQNIQEQNFLAGGGNLPNLVANAKKAGINPLAALGYSGGTAPSNSISGAGSGTAAMGQDISRAMSAMMDHQQKQEQMQTELMNAQSEKLRSEAVSNYDNVMARHLASPGSPPSAAPSQGFAVGPRSHPSRGQFAARLNPPRAYTYARLDDGSIVRVPTKDFSQQTMTHAALGPSLKGGAESVFPPGSFEHFWDPPQAAPFVKRWIENVGGSFLDVPSF